MATPEIAETLAVLKKSEKTEIHVRVIEGGNWPGLDIREFVRGAKFQGFTQKGVRVPPALVPDLLAAIAKAGGAR